MPTLIASPLGLEKIRQARSERGWGWSTDDNDECLVEASRVIDSARAWAEGGPYASGISGGTWKRFLSGRHAIGASAFKAYCQVLGLDWQEVVARDSTPVSVRRQDWGEAPDVSGFWGRTNELSQLEQWIVRDGCRLLAVLGMGGIGKTALSVKLAEQIQNQFELLIYRSLQDAPPIEELLEELIAFLSGRSEPILSETAEGRISDLMDCLRSRRCLLMLDDVESVLRGGELVGRYRDGYKGYGKLIRCIGEERHQSCLVVVSREQPMEIAALAGPMQPVRERQLSGITWEDGKRILEATGLTNSGSGLEALIQRYRGNPSALKVVAKIIQEFFGSSIAEFLDQSTVFVGDVVSEILGEQFARLSALEQDIMVWLAIACQPVSLLELKQDLWMSVSLSSLLQALQSLQRRSLIEKEQSAQSSEAIFTLQPVVMKHVTNRFIDQACRDIIAVVKAQDIQKLGLLRSHALVRDQGEQGDLKSVQMRLILNRVRDRIRDAFSRDRSVEAQLQGILSLVQGEPAQVVGYAEANLQYLLGGMRAGNEVP